MSRFTIQRPQEKLRVRSHRRATLIVVALLIFPFLCAGTWMWFQINTFGSPGKEVTIEIAKGSGISEIGDILEKNNVVNSSTAFSLYSKLARRGPYQAGQYVMPTEIGASQAAGILEKGPKINYDSFTIIPGQRLVDVQGAVDKLPGMSAEGFDEVLESHQYVSRFSPTPESSLEGMLLPETYSISTMENEADIIRRSLQEFEARAANNGLSGNVNGFTPYQLITIASLVEKEARTDDDRPLVASVIYNRLAADMPLQIDATVLYGLSRGGGSLSKTDLATDTPYNTYIHKGLVPTPISMISMDSLRAALNPADTTYLYYVLIDKETGKHAFANTYAEHLANIEKAKENGAL